MAETKFKLEYEGGEAKARPKCVYVRPSTGQAGMVLRPVATIETRERPVSTVKWQLSWRIGGQYRVHSVQKTVLEAHLALESHSASRKIDSRSAERGMSDARIHRRLCTAFHVHYQRIL